MKKNDIVADVNGSRYRVVTVNWPLVYCVSEHAPKTDVGTHVFYEDTLIALGYSHE